MNSFQQIVVTIATIILIVCLILIGITLHNKNGKEVFPPVIASCPDYWVVKNGKCKLGPNTPQPAQGCTTEFTPLNMDSSKRDKCQAQQAARQCDITWDGITNNNHLCHRSDYGN